jgi:hypothetical protein
MKDFFPYFFLKVTEDELMYLKNNEVCVLDIFEDFWRLLPDNLDASSPNHDPLSEVSPPDDTSHPTLEPLKVIDQSDPIPDQCHTTAPFLPSLPSTLSTKVSPTQPLPLTSPPLKDLSLNVQPSSTLTLTPLSPFPLTVTHSYSNPLPD